MPSTASNTAACAKLEMMMVLKRRGFALGDDLVHGLDKIERQPRIDGAHSCA
jgi:hypothetical protein